MKFWDYVLQTLGEEIIHPYLGWAVVVKNKDALEGYLDFFDDVPDDEKMDIFIELIGMIDQYQKQERKENHPIRMSEYKDGNEHIENSATRKIKKDRQIVQDFQELCSLLFDGGTRSLAHYNLQDFDRFMEDILNDYDSLENPECRPKLLNRGLYYQKSLRKEDIQTYLIDTLKAYNLPINFLHIRDFITEI